jgi:hypothetical protein
LLLSRIVQFIAVGAPENWPDVGEDTIADPRMKGHLSVLKPDQIVSIWFLECFTEEVVPWTRVDKVLNSVHVVIPDQVIGNWSTNDLVALIKDHAANI